MANQAAWAEFSRRKCLYLLRRSAGLQLRCGLLVAGWIQCFSLSVSVWTAEFGSRCLLDHSSDWLSSEDRCTPAILFPHPFRYRLAPCPLCPHIQSAGGKVYNLYACLHWVHPSRGEEGERGPMTSKEQELSKVRHLKASQQVSRQLPCQGATYRQHLLPLLSLKACLVNENWLFNWFLPVALWNCTA